MRSTRRLAGAVLLLAAAVLPPRPAQGADDRRVRKGRILYKSGKYQEAIEQFRAAVEEDARNAEAHLWLGLSFSRIAEPEKAVDSLEEARKLDPANEEVYRSLGTAYLELEGRDTAKGEHAIAKKRLAKAEEVAQELLKRTPKDKESYEYLIQLAKRQSKLDEALRHCDKVLEIDKNDVSTWLERIDILRKQGKGEEAERA